MSLALDCGTLQAVLENCVGRKETAHRIWTYRHSLDSVNHKYFLVSKYNETTQFWAWLTYFKICKMFLPLVFYFHCMFLLKSTCCVSSLLSCQLYRARLANPAQVLLGFLFLCVNWFRSSLLVIFRHTSFFFLSTFWSRQGTGIDLSQTPDIIQARLAQSLQIGRDLRTKNHFLQFFCRSWS